MEHRTFGQVVASLRKEHINFSNGQKWTQHDLAVESGLSKRIIGRIERGSQARLDGFVLSCLADAFDLTSVERREFFSMASEVTESQIVRRDLCDEDVFVQVWEMLNDLYAPAFLSDPFLDILGANRALLKLHDVDVRYLQDVKTKFGAVNNLALLLDRDTPLRQVLGQGWWSIALANLQKWRVTTLRYRHTTRFKKLFEMLSTIPDFRMLWVAGNDSERAIDDCSQLRSCIYTHELHGPVAYTVFTNTSLSTYGELHLSTFIPQNSLTADLFRDLSEDAMPAMPLEHWPNPSLTIM